MTLMNVFLARILVTLVLMAGVFPGLAVAETTAPAEKTTDGIVVRLELQAGGYNGSTYTLVYDPERDILRGVYFQAVAQQSYEVYFQRAR